MTKATGSVTINAPVAEVFDFAKDIGKLWSSWPGVAVRDVHHTPDGVGSTAHFASKMLGMPVFQGQVEFTEVVPNERIRVTSNVLAEPHFLFTFGSAAEGGTEFAIEADYHFEVPVVGDQLDQLYARLTPNALTEFAGGVKAQIEGVAAPTEKKPGAKLTREVTINAPVEKVFDVVRDIGRFWVYFPDVAVREVKVTPEGVGSSARIYTHELGLHFEGIAEIVEVVGNQRVVVKVTFGPESPLWTFSFEPVEGGTKLAAEGEWHVDIPGVGKPIGNLIAKSHTEFLEAMLANIKADLEATG